MTYRRPEGMSIPQRRFNAVERYAQSSMPGSVAGRVRHEGPRDDRSIHRQAGAGVIAGAC
jgi:hypothetical protein